MTPKLPKKVYGGDGGSYHSWCPADLAMLREGNIGAAKLALEKDGFALPRYSDSAKVAYVLQGILFLPFLVFLFVLIIWVCVVFFVLIEMWFKVWFLILLD